MAVCEKCWTDAYSRAMGDFSKTQTEHYCDLIEERKDSPCVTSDPEAPRAGGFEVCNKCHRVECICERLAI
jgi:hypothetical protein